MTRGRSQFRKYKNFIIFMVKAISLLPFRIRYKFFETFRGTKGKKGLLIRYVLLKSIAKHIGDNVSVFPNVYLFNIENLTIGDNVSIHPMSYLEALGGITIGNDVSIAHAVTILSVNHKYNDLDTLIKDQGLELKPCVIKSNVWIGAKASILAGTKVESGSIIATGTVVTKDYPENVILGGVPAKVIKERRTLGGVEHE